MTREVYSEQKRPLKLFRLLKYDKEKEVPRSNFDERPPQTPPLLRTVDFSVHRNLLGVLGRYGSRQNAHTVSWL